MEKKDIIRLIDLKMRIKKLEETDAERKKILESGSYAIAEGYRTCNMVDIERLEAEIEAL